MQTRSTKMKKNNDKELEEEGQDYYENLVGVNSENLKKNKIQVKKMN